jgi:hypothetical protein
MLMQGSFPTYFSIIPLYEVSALKGFQNHRALWSHLILYVVMKIL